MYDRGELRPMDWIVAIIAAFLICSVLWYSSWLINGFIASWPAPADFPWEDVFPGVLATFAYKLSYLFELIRDLVLSI